jgi:hypothetical protein
MVPQLTVPVYTPEPGDAILAADKLNILEADKPLQAFVAVRIVCMLRVMRLCV